MPRITKIKDPDKQTEVVTGLLGGLNTFQDETVLKESELSKAKNIILSVDGIEPRPGILHYGGQGTATKMLGGFGYYKSDGTHELLRVTNNGNLEKKNGLSWTQIGTKTYNTAARMNFLQARDNVFLFNGIDSLSYYDGTNINVYSALTTPVGLALATQGTAGTTTYSYRVSAFNAIGETLACVSVQIATGNAILDATNYNKLTWTATAGATGYNVYGNKSTGLGETYLTTVYTNAFNDKAEFTPSTVILPPEGNTTTGIISKKAVFSQSRIFAAGDPAYPSRLFYGGVGSNIGNFSFSETGGGATDIFKNDGSEIRDLLPFQGGVIVWKDNAIYKFYFNSSGQPTLEEITRSFGGIAWRGSKHVENDVVFPAKKDGRLAFYSLGNQENYSAGVLRTNELSIKIAKDLEDVLMSNIKNAAAFYFNSIYGCAITTSDSTVNNRIWCLDTRFGAWVHWDDLHPNFFTNYIDTDSSEKLYFGDEQTGYFEEMFRDERSDNGVAVSVQFATKAFNQKQFNKFKKYWNPIFQFKDISKSGSITGDIIIDGAIVSGNFTVQTQTSGGAGVGVSLVGFTLPGDAPGGVVTSGVSADTIVQLFFIKKGRSIKYEFRSEGIDARYKFLSLAHEYRILEGKPLPSSSKFYTS